MPTVFDVADFFLFRQDVDAGDTISNMTLQKLCYYAQGFSLALLNEPLYDEEIQAWQHGPVVPNLYQKYKHYGKGAITRPEKTEREIYAPFTKKQLHVLEEVHEMYGQYTASKLRDFTHDEPPWYTHYHSEDVYHNEAIPLADMKRFFDTQVVNG